MKNYKRKPDMVQAFRYTGNVSELSRAIGSAFVKEDPKPSDPTDVAVSFYDVSIHKWVPIVPGDYVVKDESGAYRKENGINFEKDYEEVNLTPPNFHPHVIGGTTGCRSSGKTVEASMQ